MRKPVASRKQARPNIPYYSLKTNGHGYWQPSAELRKLGFTSVDCGFDGPDAWARAEELNSAAREARNRPAALKKAA